MNLFGKTYKPVYIDDGAKATTSDSVSMLYLQNIKTKELTVLLFTDFVGFERSTYSIVAMAFAPARTFYFFNSLIKNYSNNPEDYSDSVLIKWASGLVENTNNRFGSVQSIGTKVLYNTDAINENRRALCTIGARDRGFNYQGRYGEGTNSCDILMDDYCSTHPDDKKCSCIAHKEYLYETAGIDPRYTTMLKPYCHVADCATDGYQSRNTIIEKQTGNCAPVNMCIQNMNLTDATILSSNVIMQCTQEQDNTTTKPEGPGDIKPGDSGGVGGGTNTGNQELPIPKPDGGTPGTGTGTGTGGTGGGTNGVKKPVEGSSPHWIEVYWPIILLIFLVIIVAVIFIKKRQAPSQGYPPVYLYNREYFTVDSTFNDNFVGTDFNF